MAKQATVFYKCLSTLLLNKRETSYCLTLRCQISFNAPTFLQSVFWSSSGIFCASFFGQSRYKCPVRDFLLHPLKHKYVVICLSFISLCFVLSSGCSRLLVTPTLEINRYLPAPFKLKSTGYLIIIIIDLH